MIGHSSDLKHSFAIKDESFFVELWNAKCDKNKTEIMGI